MKYQAIYKCRLCGEKFPFMTETNYENANELVDVMTGRKIDESISEAMYVSLLKKKKHECKDGSIAIADFQGFKAVEE